MKLLKICLLLAGSFTLAGCGPTLPPPQAGFARPMATYAPPVNTSPTMAEAGLAPSAFDHNGNANYDENGTYTGGHGIGTLVDSPEQSTFDVAKPVTPNISSMHCTGQTAANAGNLSCSN